MFFVLFYLSGDHRDLHVLTHACPTRRSSDLVKRAGGPELRIPVEFDKLDAQWFTGYDKIEITPKELLNSAVFNWSRVVGMFSLNGTELLYTRGEEEVIDLMEFYLDAAEKAEIGSASCRERGCQKV